MSVDITGKEVVYREAIAEGRIILKPTTIEIIKRGLIEKGDVFESAKVSAFYAVKNTPYVLAYCHPIKITHISFEYEISDNSILVRVLVKAIERTGVEMEALMGVLTALATIWDMVKKYEKDESGNYPSTKITDVRIVRKVKRCLNNVP